MEYIAGEHRTQSILFPELLDNYVSQENPVRVIDAYVDSLDLKTLEFGECWLIDIFECFINSKAAGEFLLWLSVKIVNQKKLLKAVEFVENNATNVNNATTFL